MDALDRVDSVVDYEEPIDNKAISAPSVPPREALTLLSLPAELRIAILEYVFASNTRLHDAFKNRSGADGITVNEAYTVAACMHPLLVCRQLYKDGTLVALDRTAFVVNSLFIANSIPQRLAVLHPKQLSALRSITCVADARFFRKMNDWGHHPFGLPTLNLDTLTLVLHRSSFWHYLFDFTADLTKLLRNLHGVRRLVFVRNQALVKGSFKTWYNRLIGLIMKVDHHERYNRSSQPCVESVWWRWSYDDHAQSFTLEALPVKALIGEEAYMQQMQPLIEQLRVNVEGEEWNPDPRSRNGF
ncbi:hypothetical protein LTR08_003145 [Meristemomyces frigidus]|nr:hypothetical protein LTR08_003145 [Meristemomyces frigidus]